MARKAGMLQKAASLFRRQPDDKPPPVEESVNEAAQNTLAKQAKIQVGLEATLLQDLRSLSQNEITTVERFKDKYLKFGPNKRGSSDNHNDLIIADKMEFTTPNPRQSPVLALIAGAAIALAGAPYLAGLTKPAGDAPKTPTVNAPDVSVDDLKLRVKWRIDENGKIKTEVIEEPPK